jgi:hypothetical protein
MTHRRSKALACAAATLLCGIAFGGLRVESFAQEEGVGSTTGGAPSGPGSESAMPPAAPSPERRAIQPAFDPIAARVQYLHDRLRITPAQEPLWAKVAEAMRENGKAVAPLIQQRLQSAQHGNAMDALSSYEKLGEAQLDELKKFIAAFEALYSGLSPAQKKIADSLFRIGPLSMIGGIPEPAEAILAPPPYTQRVPAYSADAMLPPFYPTYRSYPYYPAYPYYPGFSYYSYYPWPWRPPIVFGAPAFFLHEPHRFHAFHGAVRHR